jgi:hypothetical protein
MPLGPNTLKMTKVRVAGSDAAHRIDPSVFNLPSTQSRNGATCTTHHRASASLQPRLGNPSQTCFHVKQAARSRRVSHADLPPSVLWRNRQTKVCLVLRSKRRNCRGDFQAQITKPELPVLSPKPGETIATSFEAKLEKTVATSFEVKPSKTVRVVLRPNH